MGRLGRKFGRSRREKTPDVVRNPDGSKTIKPTARAQAALKEQLASFRERFGRDPLPNEPIFFDPDADTPQPMSDATSKKLWDDLIQTARRVGIRAPLIHAMRKTGRIVTEDNKRFLLPEELAEWEEAYAEGERIEREFD